MKTMTSIFVSVIMMMLTTNAFAQVGDATSISGPTSVCANSTAVYSTPPIDSATSYMWNVPAGATITTGYGTNVVTIQFGTSSGQVMVFGQNGTSFGNGVSLDVTVNAAPSVTITIVDQDICAGEITTLTATGTGTSFVWSGTTLTTSSVTVTPAATTTYTVTASNSNGCTASANITVNVHALPNVSLNFTEDHACTDVNSVLLTGGYPTGGDYSCSTPNVVWNGTTIHPPVIGAGTWTITYTVTDMYGCSGSADDLFTVYGVPEVMFRNIPGPVTTNSTSVDLNNFVQPQGGVFEGPGTSAGSSILDFAKAGEGTHMLTYTYTHPISGCSASQIQYVTITKGSDNGTNGVEDAIFGAISIYPNPASDVLNISDMNQSINSIVIVDMIGKVVYSTNTNSETITVDVSTFNTGTYFITFINVDGFSSTQKFMKVD